MNPCNLLGLAADPDDTYDDLINKQNKARFVTKPQFTRHFKSHHHKSASVG